jgi:hypothetical protein
MGGLPEFPSSAYSNELVFYSVMHVTKWRFPLARLASGTSLSAALVCHEARPLSLAASPQT